MLLYALLLLGLSNPDAPAEHPHAAAVAQVVEAMQSAVRAADSTAYLALVTEQDAFFRQEQRCWAEELQKAKPATFNLEFSLNEQQDKDDEIHGELSMRWSMPEKRERSLKYPARFVREASGWRFAGERWRQVVGEGFVVKFLGDQDIEAKAIAEILPEVRATVFTDFEQAEPKHIEVKVYPSQTHIQASIYLSYTDVIGGWNEPGEAIKMVNLRFGRNSKQRAMILAHEMGHVATFSLGEHAKSIPWWAQEGVAEAAAEPYWRKRQQSTAMVKQFVRSDSLKEWTALREYTPETMKLAGHVYHQGHHFIAYLTDRFGKPKRNAWLRAMASGQSLEDAARTAFGFPFAQLDAEWRAAVKANPDLLQPDR